MMSRPASSKAAGGKEQARRVAEVGSLPIRARFARWRAWPYIYAHVDVLMRVYAKCVAGQQDEAKRQILDATKTIPLSIP